MIEMEHVDVVIPNLGIGNIASITNMVRHCGFTVRVAETPSELLGTDRMILAGVGAYDAATKAIEEGGWRDSLYYYAMTQAKPILGVCLGMQLLCRSSEEGIYPGLGWFDADVQRFRLGDDSKLKVPHMGWSEVRVVRDNPLIPDDGHNRRFYFAHSYHIQCDSDADIAGTASHGYEFAAVIHHGNLMGVQFHPEKSHRFGMELLGRFMVL